MIIGVDAGALAITDERLKVGVWRVTHNLLKELAKLDPVNQYRLYSFRPIERGVMEAFGPRMENVVLRPAKGWMSLRLPIELRLRPVDVFLGLAQALPSSSSHSIGFIYDFGFLYHPEAYGESAGKLTKQTADLIKRASHIITISESSKRDIVEAYRLNKDRITVCYPGISLKRSHLFRLKGETLRKPYFLFVGSLNKAKDIPLLLRAFRAFLDKIKTDSGSPHRGAGQAPAGMTHGVLYDLYLIGGDYWPDATINQSIDLYQLQGRVHRLGFVPDAQLPAYYRGATAFLTTALREGFCLPAAEAMASGTPVVAVDRGAMKEVVGGGGIIVKERGINSASTAVADALFAIASDIGLRRKLARKALEQSKKFRWRKFAKNVKALF